MRYRAFKNIATGAFYEPLFITEGEAFDVPELSHRTDMATALGIKIDDLETVEGAVDPRSGVLIALPVVPGPSTAKELYATAASDAERLAVVARYLELLD